MSRPDSISSLSLSQEQWDQNTRVVCPGTSGLFQSNLLLNKLNLLPLSSWLCAWHTEAGLEVACMLTSTCLLHSVGGM